MNHSSDRVRCRASLLVALLVLASCTAVSGTASRAALPAARAHAPRVSKIDVEHYALDLSLHPETRSFDGSCLVRLYPRVPSLEEVELDLVGLTVSEVRDERGTPLPFTHRDGVLAIRLAQPLRGGSFTELSIRYGGTPSAGLWFTRERDGCPTQVYTHGECEDSRFWFPCWDFPSDRATSEIAVEMPAEWIAVAAGERIERTIRGSEGSGGRARELWRMAYPHPTYLTTLVAGELVQREELWDGIPLLYLAPPEYEDWLQDSFAETDEVLDFLTDMTGHRYPYPKYSQACVSSFLFGGMENISATTLTESWLGDELILRDGDRYGLLAHEAAHQWFGDWMTCRDWSHIWLNEGWATYATLLYTEATRGVDAFRVAVRDAQETYLALDVGTQRRPIVYDVYRDPLDLFVTGHAYQGSAVRLHLLRFVLGDEGFFRGTREYVADHRGRSVTTDDFQRAMERASGQDLGWFFRQWFHERGYPEFKTRWSYDESLRELSVEVEQVQDFGDGTPAVFRTPLELEFMAEDLETRRVELTRRRQRFDFTVPRRPLWVRFDPHGWIPKRLEEEQALDEWLALSEQESDVNGRRDALAAFVPLAQRAARQRDRQVLRLILTSIEERLARDPVEAVRESAARALASLAPAAGREALMAAAARDEGAPVRAAALDALAKWGEDPELAEFAEAQFEARYSWQTMAAAAELRCCALPQEAFDFLEGKLAVTSPHDTLRASLLSSLSRQTDARVVGELARWAFDERSSSTAREAAVRGLGRRARGEPEIRGALAAMLDTRDVRLRSGVIDALAELRDAGAVRALEAYYPRCVDPRQKRVIEAVLRVERSVH